MQPRNDLVDVDAELRWTVQHAYQGSVFFREHLDAAGVTPEEFRGLADLPQIPATTAPGDGPPCP